MTDRVYRVTELSDVLADILVAHAALVHAVEIGVKGKINLFVAEILATERQVSLCSDAKAIVAQVLEHLAAVEMKEEARLVFCEAQFAGVGQNDTRIVETARHVIDNHLVEHAGLGILMVDVEVHVGNLVVERTLGNLDLG